MWAAVEILIVAVGLLTGLAAPLAVVAALAFLPGRGPCLLVDLTAGASPVRSVRRGCGHPPARVDPTVVGITGSYGKTSTKGHIAHLVRPTRTVVATPASFNNRAGLARAVNEHLADGTEVFVAEMGTYGPGEIADLCRWCPPDIAVITAIGPVHLERIRLRGPHRRGQGGDPPAADDVVLQVDDRRLAAVADSAEARGNGCSDVRLSTVLPTSAWCGARGRVPASAYADGAALAEDVAVPAGMQPANLACAIAVALVLKVDPAAIGARLGDLPQVDHRLQAVPAASGVTILDDTYNSNPAGASEALGALGRAVGCRVHREEPASPAAAGGGDAGAWWSSDPASSRRTGVRRRHRRGGHRCADRGPDQPAGPAGRAGFGGRLADQVRLVPTASSRSTGSADTSVPGTSCCTRTICRTTTLEKLSRRPGPMRRRFRSTHRRSGGVQPPCPKSPSSSGVRRLSTT